MCPAMAASRKKKKRSGKTFRFQLTLSGIFGIGIVCFCLFMWMFLLGIWAGQTILLPAAKPSCAGSTGREAVLPAERPGIEVLDTGAKKKPAADVQTK
jgi:hypothetical protein